MANEAVDEPPGTFAPVGYGPVERVAVGDIGIGVDFGFVAVDVDELIVEEVVTARPPPDVLVEMSFEGTGVSHRYVAERGIEVRGEARTHETVVTAVDAEDVALGDVVDLGPVEQ